MDDIIASQERELEALKAMQGIKSYNVIPYYTNVVLRFATDTTNLDPVFNVDITNIDGSDNFICMPQMLASNKPASISDGSALGTNVWSIYYYTQTVHSTNGKVSLRVSIKKFAGAPAGNIYITLDMLTTARVSVSGALLENVVNSLE